MEKVSPKQLIDQIVNEHAAQTGVATVHGGDIIDLVYETEPEGWQSQDYALAELICQRVLRAKPVVTEEL